MSVRHTEPAAYTIDSLGIPRLISPLPETCVKPRRTRFYAMKTRDIVYRACCYRCVVCGRTEGPLIHHSDESGDYVTSANGVWLTLHHVVAHSRGGCSHPHNLVVLCDQCNNRIGVSS